MADTPPAAPSAPSPPSAPQAPSAPSPGGSIPSFTPDMGISAPPLSLPPGLPPQGTPTESSRSRPEGEGSPYPLPKSPASVGRPSLPPEYLDRWEHYPNRIVADYLFAGIVLPVTSSNVVSFQYSIKSHELVVKYKSGLYKYFGVSEQEAEALATAGSHGGACWDILRVRGSDKAHKKNYVKIG